MPDSQGSDDEDNNLRRAQTFATLLTAAYWKARVSQEYSSGTETREMQLYTIGVRMDSANSPGLAKIVLNPQKNLEKGASEFSDNFIGYIESYLDSKKVEIPDAGKDNHTTAFQPDPALGLNDIDDLKYNNGFYEVTGEGSNLDWSTVLEEVIAHVTDTVPKVPTHVNTGDLDSDGYITYVDPIGEYMEVKAVKTLIFNHQVYHLENPRGEKQDDGSTVYTFSAGTQVPSPAGGMVSLEDVHIYVTPDEDTNTETLTVEIPASLIPLRTNTVTLDVNGNPVSNVSNNAYPLRLFYTVGLREGIVDRQTGKVITEAVSDDYLDTHSNEDGTVNFYANRYSGMGADQTGASIVNNPAENAATVGDAYTTFTPARDNPFYFVQEDTPLFLDEGLTQKATDELQTGKYYYFQIRYYEGTSLQTAVVKRPAESFMANDAIWDVQPTGDGGQLEIQAGRPRLGYLIDFIRYKDASYGHYYDPDGDGGVDTNPGNYTGTASTFYYPTYEGGADGAGAFKMYLGNNGRVTAGAPDPAVGTLSIGKFVVGEETDTGFTFTVQLTDGSKNPLTGSFNYTGAASDLDVEAPANGTLNLMNGSGTITLKNGQGIIIQGLPKGTRWTVTENPDGDGNYAVTAYVTSAGSVTSGGNAASGTIAHHGAEDVVSFVNLYQAPTGTLVVKKEVEGDIPPDAENAQYEFKITLQKPGEDPTINEFKLKDGDSETFTDLPLGTTYTVTEVIESSGDEEEQPGESEIPEQSDQENTENTEGGEGEPDSNDTATPGGGDGDPQLPDDGTGGQPGSGEPAGNENPADTDDVEDSGDSQSPDSAGEGETAPPPRGGSGFGGRPAGRPRRDHRGAPPGSAYPFRCQHPIRFRRSNFHSRHHPWEWGRPGRQHARQ